MQQPDGHPKNTWGIDEDAQKGVLETLGAECVVPEIHIHLSLPCRLERPREYVMLPVMQPSCARGSHVTVPLSLCQKVWPSS